ncbi:MAG: type II secretion system major pseudopilin GspG [Candidatus Kaelpia imicola]|nr:type II secretion system major pseudopilin GspG [Candidatus Kaelpia imicola]
MKRNAFTLVELLVVITIIGILTATILPRLAGRTGEARIKRAESEIYGTLSTALDMYELDIGRYPDSLECLWRLDAPSGFDVDEYSSLWEGPYIKRARVRGNSILDPWGNPYQYESVDQGSSYKISSQGANTQDSNDDIVYSGEMTFED